MHANRIVVAAALTAFALAGAVDAFAGSKVKTVVAPNLADYPVRKIAVLGLANTTGVNAAEQMGVYVVQALSATERSYFAPAQRFALDAKRTGLEAEYSRMLSTWQKKRTVDEEVVAQVLRATGYDAVLGIEVSEWKQNQLEATQEGTSDTMIGALVRLYAADGTLLWSATERRTEHSQPYLPSFNLKPTASGETRTTSASAVPQPPPYEEVAQDVARALAGTLPSLEGKKKDEAPKGAPGE
jgi:hypothetical protein